MSIFHASTGLLNIKLPFYHPRPCHAVCQHSKIASYNFIQIFCGLPLPLCPSTISPLFFIQLSFPILSTCPNHVSLTLVVSYAYQPQAISQKSRRLSILQCHITLPPYHDVISLQLCQSSPFMPMSCFHI